MSNANTCKQTAPSRLLSPTFLTLALAFSISAATAQNFTNGSFELNSGLCLINADNSTITSNLTAVTGYGCGNEIDLMNNTCGYGTAVSGEYFLCLANSTGTCPDGCTLELNENLVSGNTYSISYFDRGWDVNGCCPPGVPLEVGVSTSAISQGSVVYTSPVPTLNAWSQRTFTFVAPVSGKYISFQAQNDNNTWTHFDSVTITGGCPSPANLSAINITASSAKLKWDPVSGAIGYQIAYKSTNASPWTLVHSPINSKQISGLTPSTKYFWKVKTVCNSSPLITSGSSAQANFTTGPLRMADESVEQPSFQIYPNPAEDHATIHFTLAQPSHVCGKVYDVSGEEMATIVNNNLEQGNYSLPLNTAHFAKGVFIVRMIIDDGIVEGTSYEENQKLIVQ